MVRGHDLDAALCYSAPVGKPGRHKTRPSKETSKSGVFQRAAKTSRTATRAGRSEYRQQIFAMPTLNPSALEHTSLSADAAKQRGNPNEDSRARRGQREEQFPPKHVYRTRAFENAGAQSGHVRPSLAAPLLAAIQQTLPLARAVHIYHLHLATVFEL